MLNAVNLGLNQGMIVNQGVQTPERFSESKLDYRQNPPYSLDRAHIEGNGVAQSCVGIFCNLFYNAISKSLRVDTRSKNKEAGSMSQVYRTLARRLAKNKIAGIKSL